MHEADKFMSQVVCLRQTADDLQRCLNQINPKAVEQAARLGKTEQSARIGGYFFSAVILRALATEITLKVLSSKKTGKYKKVHDLLILFNDLDSDTRKIVSDLEKSHGVRPLEKILGKHRDDFVEWRYPMESQGELKVDLLDLDKALNILITVYNHADFKRLCANKK